MRTRALIAAVVAAACLAPDATADSDPGIHEWQPVPRDRVAAECRMDPDLLEQAATRLNDTPWVVVRYGKLCWEGGYPSGTTGKYHVASITKTFGGLLTGMVDARSTLSDEDPVTRWIPRESLGAINPAAKIAHVLAMASTNKDFAYGKKAKWTYDTLGDREINQLVGVMDKVIAAEPSGFGGSADAREFAQREMFDPLGMKTSDWPGQAIGGTMNSTVRDMARMGELILQRGRYDGRQILDEDYVYKMTHPSFEDANTGFGYLAYANADKNWVYSTGTNDTKCSPYTRWPSYPHRPFFEAPDPNGGFPGTQKHDIGLTWAAGAGGQKISVHRGLDMVIVVRDDAVSIGESEPVGQFEGHKNIWNAIRPALVALDPVYKGDEAAFCRAYQRSEYAPDLHERWFKESTSTGGGRPIGRLAEPSAPVGRCVSRRAVRVGITRPRGMKVRRVSVTVDGRAIAVRRGKRMSALVDLRGRGPATAIVRIRVDGTRRGRSTTVRQTRAFRTCLARGAPDSRGRGRQGRVRGGSPDR